MNGLEDVRTENSSIQGQILAWTDLYVLGSLDRGRPYSHPNPRMPLDPGYHKSRRCSRDTYPESCITKYTSIRGGKVCVDSYGTRDERDRHSRPESGLGLSYFRYEPPLRCSLLAQQRPSKRAECRWSLLSADSARLRAGLVPFRDRSLLAPGRGCRITRVAHGKAVSTDRLASASA